MRQKRKPKKILQPTKEEIEKIYLYNDRNEINKNPKTIIFRSNKETPKNPDKNKS